MDAHIHLYKYISPFFLWSFITILMYIYEFSVVGLQRRRPYHYEGGAQLVRDDCGANATVPAASASSGTVSQTDSSSYYVHPRPQAADEQRK